MKSVSIWLVLVSRLPTSDAFALNVGAGDECCCLPGDVAEQCGEEMFAPQRYSLDCDFKPGTLILMRTAF
jgi:hypothetical protein